MLCALIMAGGKGTRFWPLSTAEKPKQFLSLLGEDTMIQMTIKRLLPLIPIEQIFVVTGKQYEPLVQEQLPNLPKQNIILEPYGKNTAPCIALSAFHINKQYKDATIAVLPSDHLIQDEEKFLEVLKTGHAFVKENKETIVTIGMKPDRPETGYGYINFNKPNSELKEKQVLNVNQFVEKPNKETAEHYIGEGNYLWNGGMFIWKASNILSLTKQHLNNTYHVLNEIMSASDSEYAKVLEEKYKNVDGVSVDYGIMEKTDSIYVIPSEFGWDDVGSWSAIERYTEKDEHGSFVMGDGCYVDGKNNMIVCNASKVIIHGLSDIYVVENDGNIVVGRRDKVDRIKEVKERIAAV